MRVATRIAVGSGVAIVLLLAVLAWDLSLVARLAGINQELSQINLQVSTITLQQVRLLNQADEFIRKYHVTRDPAYEQRMRELNRSFALELSRLSSLALSVRERRQVIELARLWERYWRETVAFPPAEARLPDKTTALEEELLSTLSRLREQVERVNLTSRLAVLEQANRSAETSGRAQKISWQIVASALLLSVAILWLTIRSINRPLRLLTAGTQAVAEGEFSVQLETQGDDELSRLGSSFNQMVLRLGEAERTKKEFLSHVSHELKTPLASMHETNELLLEEIPGPLTSRQRRFLMLNLESGRRLSAMISKLLDLSRLEAGAIDYDFRCHDLVALARAVVAGFEARAREREVRLLLQAPASPVPVDCDRDRMAQVLENLIDNAFKFSPTGEAIEIRVYPRFEATRDGRQAARHLSSSSVGEAAEIVIEVADAGPGIPDEQKELIFERFQQLRPVGAGERAAGGVGLGLAICRQILTAHKGTVEVRDGEGSGSVFRVLLPPAKKSRMPVEQPLPGSTRRRVEA